MFDNEYDGRPFIYLDGRRFGGDENWIGFVGANIAAIFLSAFGWTAYFIPVLIVLIAWRVYQSDTLVPRASRVAGFVFFAVSLSGLLALVGGYGAIVGEAAAQSTAHFIGSIGAGIFLLAIFISSILLITNFTLESFHSHFNVAWENIRIRINEVLEKRREARSPEMAAAKGRAEKRKKQREKVEKTSEITVPPTIAVGEIEAMAAAVGRSEPLFADDDRYGSIPTIDAGREILRDTKRSPSPRSKM